MVLSLAQIEAALVGVPNFSWAELTISEAEVNEGIANVQTIIGGTTVQRSIS